MCGITGVFAPGRDAARLAFFALYALQHRGQESAGIAAADGGTIRSHKEMGLLGAIFDEEILSELSGYIAIGHTRYSTTGSSIVVNAQPLLERTELGDFAFAHNGNLTNTDELRESLSPTTVLQASSDSEVMAKMIVETKGSMFDRIAAVLARARGAYSVVLCTQDELYAFRDPWGVRPLCLGALNEGGYVVASESCALGTVGAQYRTRDRTRRDRADYCVRTRVAPHADVEDAQQALCMFEYIYFARPDSRLNDRSDLHGALRNGASAGARASGRSRRRDGGPRLGRRRRHRLCRRERLAVYRGAHQEPLHRAHVHQPGSEDALRAACISSSIRWSRILRGSARDRGRRFDRPRHDDAAHRRALREAGAREVHLRITSPPIKHPCYLGVDMATYDELIAANYTVDEIRRKTGADSLGYLSLDGLIGAVGRKREDMCLGCFVGDYPNVPSTHAPHELHVTNA